MENRLLRLFALVMLIALPLTGCAAKADRVQPKKINTIEKVAFVTTAAESGFTVLDHTGIERSNQTIYYSATGNVAVDVIGTLVANIAAMKIDEMAEAKIQESMGGTPDILMDTLVGFDPKERLDENLTNRLSLTFEVADLEKIDSKREGENGQDLITLCRQADIDALVTVKYSYGLAVYDGKKSSAAIVAELRIYDFNRPKILVDKKIFSDALFPRRAHGRRICGRQRLVIQKRH